MIVRRPHLQSTLLVLSLAAIGYGLQSRTYLNHDVAWILWGARAMLHGAIFGRDIIEPNPPLAWYLSLPPVWLAETLGWPIDVVYRLGITLLGCLSLACAQYRLSATTSLLAPAALPVFIALAALSFFLLCGRDFGQREHIMIMLVLPYMLGAANRIAATEPALRKGPFSAVLPILIGIAAGLGFAIKPYFYVAPFLIEGLVLYRGRNMSLLTGAETIGIPFVALLYAAMVLFFDRSYLDFVMPLAMPIYWAFNMPIPNVVWPVLLAACALGLVLWMNWRLRPSPPLPAILAIAALGFLLAHLIQMKGYSYHALPFVTCTIMSLASILSVAQRRAIAFRPAIVALGLTVALSAYSTAQWWWDFNRDFGLSGRVLSELIGAVDAQRAVHERDEAGPDSVATGGFLAISTHPIPGFPTALYADARWTSRTNSQWFLPAVVALREGRAASDPALLAFAESNARSFMLHDLRARPWIVLVDSGSDRHAMAGSDFDFLAFYQADPAFRALWQSYRESAMIGRFRVFLRDRDGTD